MLTAECLYMCLLSVQTMKNKPFYITALTGLMWSRSTFCNGFAVLEMKISVWYVDWTNTDPREPKTAQMQRFMSGQNLIYVNENKKGISCHSKICTFNPILTDSIMFTCDDIYSKSHYLILESGMLHAALAISKNVYMLYEKLKKKDMSKGFVSFWESLESRDVLL